MSKKRNPGDWVWLAPNAGFVGESNRLRAQIVGDDWEPCYICDDKSCREWATLHTEPDPENDGKQYALCHVSECQMFDEQQIVED